VLEVFSLLTMGFWPEQICEEMAIRPQDLKKLKRDIQKKLGLGSEIELIKFLAAHFDGPGSLSLPRFGCRGGLAGSEEQHRSSDPTGRIRP
jgi:hypothetical protein